MNNPFDSQEAPIEQAVEAAEVSADAGSQPSVGKAKRIAINKKVLLLILLVVLLAFGGVGFMLMSGEDSHKPQPTELAAPVAPIAPVADSAAPLVPPAAPSAPVAAPAAVAPLAPTVPLVAATSPAAPAPVAPVAPAAVVPATPPVAAPAIHPCEQRMIDHATQNGADAKAYVAQNQAYLEQCKQAMAAGAQ